MVVGVWVIRYTYRIRLIVVSHLPTRDFMNFKSILWLFPFLSFSAGYLITRSLFHHPRAQTPSLVGKSLLEAFALLSNNNLSPRLLDQKIDPDLPEGTIINQIPAAGQSIKQRQTVFLVLSKKPPITPCPLLIGKSIEEIKKLSKSAGYKIKIYPVVSNYPTNQCIAQHPRPKEPVEKNMIIAYVCAPSRKPIVWPNFTDKPLNQVTEFLHQYHIDPHIVSQSQRTTSRTRVVDQRPLAGSLVSLYANQPPYVQLHVR